MAGIDGCDLVVVGAGLFGITIARQAADAGFSVVILEKRNHVGGNAHSYLDHETGIEVHRYGSHLFHTSNTRVWNFARRFTEFTNYRHHVFTRHNGQIFSMPINLGTITQFFGKAMTPDEARALVESSSAGYGNDSSLPLNFEEKAISLVGRPLYNAFIKNYTQKQWGVDPRNLPSDIITRLPVRFSFDSRYFSDTWEGLPFDGYSAWFARMLDTPRIQVFLESDYFEVRESLGRDKPLVYTGPLDKYFDFSEGELAWRTLDFTFETLEVSDHQGTSVMNYADANVPFTRIHEFKHLHPERANKSRKTVVAYEYSRVASRSDEPYYPINSAMDREMLMKYRALANAERNVFFGGRLGTYQYLDMHMAIASALSQWDNTIFPALNG